MENCLYRGRTICTFDLKDNNGYYYEDLVLEWKQAAAEKQLTCTDCGAKVYLAAGMIKEPYFAHYDLEDCDYESGHESEELKKGKRLLYQLLRRSFPDSDIQAHFRMENGLYSTLYCIQEEGRSFAVDYRLQNNSLEKFRERDTFYQANKIKPIYVIGKRQEKDTKQIDWYQNLLQNSMGYLAFLDVQQEKVTLKKSFSYRLGNMREFAYCILTYAIKDLLLDEDARMLCDFTEECNKTEQKILEEKQQYQKRQEQLRELREEQLRLEEKYRLQQEVYRRSMVQEEFDLRSKDINKPDSPMLGVITEQVKKVLKDKNTNVLATSMLNPKLLDKCKQMIAEGNAHLVSKKYYDAIMNEECRIKNVE